MLEIIRWQWNLITLCYNICKIRTKAWGVKNVEIALSSTHPNHCALSMVPDNTRISEKIDWELMIFSKSTNGDKIEMKIRHKQHIWQE